MNYDLCIHLDVNEAGMLGFALTNIANYMAALPGETYKVRLVANGPAVQLFRRETCPHAQRIAELAAAGVTFALCANALRVFSVAKEELLPACEVVPAGMVELVRLQREGYAYIRP